MPKMDFCGGGGELINWNFFEVNLNEEGTLIYRERKAIILVGSLISRCTMALKILNI
jgi:hypothetical protein